jgi:cytochrome c
MRAWVITAVLLGTQQMAAAQQQGGDPIRGQGVFRACAACHSLEPNRNLTGPSLSDLWGRKAGSLGGFRRYSPALKSSAVVWNDRTLDPWLRDPKAFIPGNHMTFPGIKDAQARSDLLAYLRDATRPGAAPTRSARGEDGMGSMMGSGATPNLKKLDPGERVQTIGYCGDTYRVTTADGESREFWERNLRFKTDSGEDGPEPGAPALVGAGMMGDRANVIFAGPEEFARFIARRCGDEVR